jgi:starch-binding outer membrane protein, SusD/RagB family
MRAYIKTSIMLGALLGTVGCTDLTETPYEEITEANFNPTAADVAALMGPVYTPNRAIWMSWYGWVDWQEETADAMVSPVRPNGWDDGGIYYANHQHRWSASSPGMPNSLWGNAFSGINAANRVLYQIESGTLPMAAALKDSTIAELKSQRAFYYWLLMDNFGNIPIQTDFLSTELPEQRTRKQAFDFIVKELTENTPKLSRVSTPGGTMHGRMNYWAARAVLAKIYLNAEVYTGTPEWQKVLEITQEIIGSNRFSLEAAYRAPFRRDNHLSPELVFAVPYDGVFATQSNFHMKTLKPALRFVFNIAQPWGGIASNPQFIDTYDPEDTRFNGTAADAGKGGTWLTGPQFDGQGRGYTFEKRVPHMRDNGCAGVRLRFEDGFPVWKYEIYQGQTGASDVDYPIIRYAEILMMRAEALLRTGDAAGAAALVTQVRRRAFNATNPAKATVSGADLMGGSKYNYGWFDCDGVVKTTQGGAPVTNGGADIRYGRFLDELGWEFAAEGHRRQDLIRFGVFTTKRWFNHNPSSPNHIIFPIPQSRLNTNPKLKQNPGY